MINNIYTFNTWCILLIDQLLEKAISIWIFSKFMNFEDKPVFIMFILFLRLCIINISIRTYFFGKSRNRCILFLVYFWKSPEFKWNCINILNFRRFIFLIVCSIAKLYSRIRFFIVNIAFNLRIIRFLFLKSSEFCGFPGLNAQVRLYKRFFHKHCIHKGQKRLKFTISNKRD